MLNDIFCNVNVREAINKFIYIQIFEVLDM